MTRYKDVDGVRVPHTAEDDAFFDALKIEAESKAFDRALGNLRLQRNNLLLETDWMVLADSAVADKTAWQNYRTELRDLTNGLTTVEEVDAVIWPIKPGA